MLQRTPTEAAFWSRNSKPTSKRKLAQLAGDEPGSAIPFMIWLHQGDHRTANPNTFLRHFDYYFWFFGIMAKLPYERNIEVSYDGFVGRDAQ